MHLRRDLKKWCIIFILYTAIVFTVLLVSRFLIGGNTKVNNVFGLFILSLGSAFLPCIGGYFEKFTFVSVYSLSVIVGLIYALYVAVKDIAPGWGDLTSIIGYLVIVVIGIIIGCVAEIVYMIFKHYNGTDD